MGTSFKSSQNSHQNKKNMFLSKNSFKLFGLQCLRLSQVDTKGLSVSLGAFYNVYHFICSISLLSN